MSHDNHEDLPGYDARQIWKDGCEECEHRSRNLPSTVNSLDSDTFWRAWHRAKALNESHFGPRGAAWEEYVLQVHGPMSRAERPLLDLLWSMQIAFERHINLPIGARPIGH